MARRNPYRTLFLLTVAAGIVFFSLVATGLAALVGPHPTPTPAATPTSATPGPATPTDGATGAPSPTGGEALPPLEVRFLDVGQADSVLIRVDGQAMLIDAGNNDDAAGLVAYLKGLGISRLECVVGTHPHEDHIGGLDKVIGSFEVGKVLMPKVSNNTATYEDVLAAIAAKGLQVTSPKVGDAFALGGATFTVLSPAGSSYDELNLWSIVLRMTYGGRTFLFTGDAQAVNESEMLASGLDLSADVLKVAHHGSTTSSTSAFLAAVSPRIAVIEVGAGNTYNHPAQQTLDRLADVGATVYRTDEAGTIIVRSDGTTLDVSFETTAIDGSGK